MQLPDPDHNLEKFWRANLNQSDPHYKQAPEPRIEWLINMADQWLELGDPKSAELIYALVLKIDEGNVSATVGLCDITEDWHLKLNLLKTLLRLHPESRLGKALFEEAKFRCDQLKEIEDTACNQHYLSRVQRRQNQFKTGLVAGFKLNKAAGRIGDLMLEAGYISGEQLESAVNLQTMFDRLETHEPLGKLLIDYGYINTKQLEETLRLQKLQLNCYLN